jgi:hypothetical protein
MRQRKPSPLDREELEALSRQLVAHARALATIAQMLVANPPARSDGGEDLGAVPEDVADIDPFAVLRGPPRAAPAPSPKATPPASRPRASEADDDPPMKDGMRRILTALAQCSAGLSNTQLSVRAGFAMSGTFSGYLAEASRNGWTVGGSVNRCITEEGRKALGSWEPLPTGRALLEHWIRVLGPKSGAARMLRALHAHPRGLTKEQLGDAVDMSQSGTFSGYLAHLRKLQLIVGHRGGVIAASPDLFDDPTAAKEAAHR